MNQPIENPYKAPQAIETVHQAELMVDPQKVRPLRAVIKWLVICGLSAAPSMFWGVMVSTQRPSQILGMIAGILVFVAAYSMAECTPAVQRFLNRRHVRLTARIGYGTRVLISVILVGAYLDMIVGMAALSFSSLIFSDMGPGTDGQGGPMLMFISYMFTTIVQGVLLNIFLGMYMLFVYVICKLAGSK